jgi:hypothetical protein
MSDKPLFESWDGTDVPPKMEPDSVQELKRSVRRLRIWLGVVTAGLVLLLLGSCSPIAIIAVLAATSNGAPSQSEIASLRSSVQSGLGDRLSSLEVRSISIKDPTTPFPFSAFGLGHDIYIQGQLKGSGVTIAATVPQGSDPAASGLVPTQGALTDRMTDAQLDRFLAAFHHETSQPFGGVTRYSPQNSSAAASGTVTIAGTAYPLQELWSATIGRLVSGNSIDLVSSGSNTTQALVFWENPKTGEFQFLGKESASDPSLMGGD